MEYPSDVLSCCIVNSLTYYKDTYNRNDKNVDIIIDLVCKECSDNWKNIKKYPITFDYILGALKIYKEDFNDTITFSSMELINDIINELKS
jgi:hypothetical protein